jgi:hypothetical protein
MEDCESDKTFIVDIVSPIIYYLLVLAVLLLNCFVDSCPVTRTYPVDEVSVN